ncbi:hypothetical protein [Robertkochia sediminum]|nr:hypothetical protein [Robertkochia sediminum]MBL7471435.1 hypothetical protein [Robertkochia sediminum]
MRKALAIVLFFLALWLFILAVINRISAPGLTALGFVIIGYLVWTGRDL